MKKVELHPENLYSGINIYHTANEMKGWGYFSEEQ